MQYVKAMRASWYTCQKHAVLGRDEGGGNVLTQHQPVGPRAVADAPKTRLRKAEPRATRSDSIPMHGLAGRENRTGEPMSVPSRLQKADGKTETWQSGGEVPPTYQVKTRPHLAGGGVDAIDAKQQTRA